MPVMMVQIGMLKTSIQMPLVIQALILIVPMDFMLVTAFIPTNQIGR